MYPHLRRSASQECVRSASSGCAAIQVLLPAPAAPAKRKILRAIGAVFLRRRRLWLGLSTVFQDIISLSTLTAQCKTHIQTYTYKRHVFCCLQLALNELDISLKKGNITRTYIRITKMHIISVTVQCATQLPGL